MVARLGSSSLGVEAFTSDPGRIAAQIITGIGFIGAGVIIKEGFTVRGLTTPAVLWFVAGIGMASGAGLYKIAVSATAIGIFSLVSLHYAEKIHRKDPTGQS